MCIKFTQVNNCQVPGHYQINSIGKINQFEVHCALHCPKSLAATFEKICTKKPASHSVLTICGPLKNIKIPLIVRRIDQQTMLIWWKKKEIDELKSRDFFLQLIMPIEKKHFLACIYLKIKGTIQNLFQLSSVG